MREALMRLIADGETLRLKDLATHDVGLKTSNIEAAAIGPARGPSVWESVSAAYDKVREDLAAEEDCEANYTMKFEDPNRLWQVQEWVEVGRSRPATSISIDIRCPPPAISNESASVGEIEDFELANKVHRPPEDEDSIYSEPTATLPPHRSKEKDQDGQIPLLDPNDPETETVIISPDDSSDTNNSTGTGNASDQ